MAKIIVIYVSDYGNTEKMAKAVIEGAKSVNGTITTLKQAEEVVAEDLLASDAIVVGTPVHMGSPDWRVKKLIDTVCSKLWMKDALNGKVAGVFASGGGFGGGGGGCELTLLSLLNNFAELGMLLVPLPKNTPGYRLGGIQWGPYGRSAGVNMEQTGLNSEALEVSRHHGANIARVAIALKSQEIFLNPTSV